MSKQPRLGLERAGLHQLPRIEAHVGLGEGVEDLFEPLHDRAVAGDEHRAVRFESGANGAHDAVAVAGTDARIAGNGAALAAHRVENALGAAKIRGVELVEQPRDNPGEIAWVRSRRSSAASVVGLHQGKRLGRDQSGLHSLRNSGANDRRLTLI